MRLCDRCSRSWASVCEARRAVALRRAVLVAGWLLAPFDAAPLSLRQKATAGVKRNDGEIFAKKIISVTEEGELVLNQDLKTMIQSAGVVGMQKKPVHAIVVFGSKKTGKSTVSTLLCCKMAQEPVHFHSYKWHSDTAHCTNRTLGIWMSPPFEREKEWYIIFDMEGLNDGCNNPTRKQAILKMIATFTEVASVFLQVFAKDTDQFKDIGMAMKETRQHLIASAADVETKTNSLVKTANHAGLVISKQVLKSEIEASTPEADRDKAARAFDHLEDVDKDLQKLLVQNFDGVDNQHVTIEGTSYRMPWSFTFLPELRVQNDKDKQFDDTYDWADRPPFEHHEGCDTLTNMTDERWQGTLVETYSHKLDELEQAIVKRTVERRVIWDVEGGGKGQPLDGPMLWDVLEYGVQEMNSIGPLPDDQMWRLIMGGGCEQKCKDTIDELLGHEVGSLAKIKVLAEKGGNSADAIATIWKKEYPIATQRVDGLIEGTFAAVKETCNKATYSYLELLTTEKNRLYTKAQLHRAEEEARAAQEALNAKLWEEKRIAITIWAVCGTIVLIIFVRIFRQFCMTCRTLCGCCARCCTKKETTTTYETTNEDGVEMQATRVETRTPAWQETLTNWTDKLPDWSTSPSEKAMDERLSRIEAMIEKLVTASGVGAGRKSSSAPDADTSSSAKTA